MNTEKPIAMWARHAADRRSVALSRIRAKLSMAGFRDDLILKYAPRPCARLLDVACGGGRPLLTRVAEIVCGVEPEPSLAAQASRLYSHVSQCEAQAMDCDSGVYECVVCTDALGHMDRKASVAAEMFRVLRPGGRVIITCETRSSGWLDQVGQLDPHLYQRNAIDRPDHRKLETPNATVGYFAMAGFSSIRAQPVQARIPECGIISALLDGYRGLPFWLRAVRWCDWVLSRCHPVRELASLALTPLAAGLNRLEPLANASMITIVADKPN